MNIKLNNFIAEFKEAVQKRQIRILREQKINYGWQIVCCRGAEQAVINFYCGKKGLSTVLQGTENTLREELAGLAEEISAGRSHLGNAALPFGEEKTLAAGTDICIPSGTEAWMGCDESGKGDVFGPIVCAACTVTVNEARILRQIGVCDSKQLTDSVIDNRAEQIKILLKNRWSVRVVMPAEYNFLYDKFKKQRKNLNHLLGYLHGHNIQLLLSKYECPCIIVDKFGKEEYVLSELGGLEQNHMIIQVPRGERDVAVAAASILARQGFVRAMAELEKTYGMFFPKGAYMGIVQAIQDFSAKYGEEHLDQVGKLNFKNFDFMR